MNTYRIHVDQFDSGTGTRRDWWTYKRAASEQEAIDETLAYEGDVRIIEVELFDRAG